MAVFRVERNTGYTVMSNHHLRNKELTLKAKGLLSQMLSLPEDWDYTLAGLSYINREKIDAIREAVRELERAGYIQRSRERDEKGRLRGADYIIYEQPPNLDLPTLENPTLGNPTLENPTQEKPSLSVSDVVVLHQNGQDTAHYVDSFGYKDVPEFLQPENYLKTAEQTTEQNYNMIDGQINNTPTAAELEEKAKVEGQISLAEYAEALKVEKKQAAPEKKPSIRAQLRAAKEQTPKKQAKQKTQDLERS